MSTHPLPLNRVIVALTGILACGCLTGCSELRIWASMCVQVGDAGYLPQSSFAANSEYRIIISDALPAFVYLLRREPAGEYRTLFPDPQINGGSAFLPGGSVLSLPAGGAYRFPSENGTVELLLIVSTRRTRDLDLLAAGSSRDASAVEDIVRVFAESPGTVIGARAVPAGVRGADADASVAAPLMGATSDLWFSTRAPPVSPEYERQLELARQRARKLQGEARQKKLDGPGESPLEDLIYADIQVRLLSGFGGYPLFVVSSHENVGAVVSFSLRHELR